MSVCNPARIAFSRRWWKIMAIWWTNSELLEMWCIHTYIDTHWPGMANHRPVLRPQPYIHIRSMVEWREKNKSRIGASKYLLCTSNWRIAIASHLMLHYWGTKWTFQAPSYTTITTIRRRIDLIDLPPLTPSNSCLSFFFSFDFFPLDRACPRSFFPSFGSMKNGTTYWKMTKCFDASHVSFCRWPPRCTDDVEWKGEEMQKPTRLWMSPFEMTLFLKYSPQWT